VSYCAPYRAVNTALLDTYQLKSLDAVLEVPVERMRIRRRGGKHYVVVDGLKLSHTTATSSSSSSSSSESLDESFITPADYDNFALREPYDRIIRCVILCLLGEF